jgi:hypothetical protein
MIEYDEGYQQGIQFILLLKQKNIVFRLIYNEINHAQYLS